MVLPLVTHETPTLYAPLEEFKVRGRLIAKTEGMLRCVPLSANKFHIRNRAGWNYEFEIAWEGSSGAALLAMEGAVNGITTYAKPSTLLALKLSHRYLKNSPHFLKTMRDIQAMRAAGVELTPELQEWLPHREAETYVYAHPKLDVSKKDFFAGDGVNYVFDHDDLHRILAIEESPAYTKYMVEGEQVLTSREKFFTVSGNVRLLGGLEEALVLACERSQIPYNFEPDARWSFEMALMKVCTSITSGYFREFCWENYDKIVELYHLTGGDTYVEKVKKEISNGTVKPFQRVLGAM